MHRGYVVNLRRVVEVRPLLNGTAMLVLADGSEVPIARRQVGELRRRLARVSRPRTPRDELADASPHGALYLRRLIRSQLALCLLALVAFGGLLGALPLVLFLLPGLGPRPARASRCRCCSSRAAVPALRRARLALPAPRRGARRVVPRLADRRAVIALARSLAVTAGASGWDLGRALRAHDVGPVRGLARRLAVVERGGDLRRVPVGRVVPGHRRAADEAGRGALWLPLGFTAGYLTLLLFVAAPLRRLGAYTIPDFAEARLGSPRLRLLAAAIVLVIGGFYLVPQLKGAGLTLGVVTGAPYWVGVVVVGLVVASIVALGGMRGDHLRPGLPVLGQDVRDLRCRRSSC